MSKVALESPKKGLTAKGMTVVLVSLVRGTVGDQS